MTQPKIDGVGADAPTATNAHGGNQSHLPYRCDLLQPHALLHLAKIMEYGARKYGANNWHKITCNEHLNHALTHLFAHLAGDTQDDHLGHAAWRIMSALDQVLSGREKALQAVARLGPVAEVSKTITPEDDSPPFGVRITHDRVLEDLAKAAWGAAPPPPHKFVVGDKVSRRQPFYWGSNFGVVRGHGSLHPYIGNPDDPHQNSYCLESELTLVEEQKAQ